MARFQKCTPRRSDPAVDSFKCRRGYVSGLDDRSNRAARSAPHFMMRRALALVVVVQLLKNWVATGSAQQARPEQDSRGCLGGAIDRLSPPQWLAHWQQLRLLRFEADEPPWCSFRRGPFGAFLPVQGGASVRRAPGPSAHSNCSLLLANRRQFSRPDGPGDLHLSASRQLLDVR